jgi:drug/metabolite transporter (DMT)-like permease
MIPNATTTHPLGAERARERAQYRRGALLVAGAAVAWSSAGLLVRTTVTDNWTTLFWRSVFAALFLALYIAVREGRGAARGFARLGLPGLGIAFAFATSMTCFIVGLRETSVANVLIFQSAAPFVAAILGWFWLGERVSWRAGAAILASLAGILVMVSDSVTKGRVLGDVVSAIMGISFAFVIVEMRRHRDVAMTPAMCLGLVLTGLAALPFAEFAPTLRDLCLLALFGIGQMGLALMLFTAGVRLLPAADAGLISILEVILAPIWVWLAFGEDPGPRALLGGAIVLSAVVGHTVVEKRAAAGSSRQRMMSEPE